MEKFKEKINQLKSEIDGANLRAETADRKIGHLQEQLGAKGILIFEGC